VVGREVSIGFREGVVVVVVMVAMGVAYLKTLPALRPGALLWRNTDGRVSLFPVSL